MSKTIGAGVSGVATKFTPVATSVELLHIRFLKSDSSKAIHIGGGYILPSTRLFHKEL